jgi:DNA repair ATPase RecN
MKQKYFSRIGEKAILDANIARLNKDLQDSIATQENNQKVITLLTKTAEVSRGAVKKHIEDVCTTALKFVFDKDLEFVIDMSEHKNGAVAEFFIQYTDGKDTIKVKPENASGGGVIDVLSTALRFCFLELLNDPKIQGPVILDEPAKMVSEIAATKMALLLKELKTSFNRQVIMSTHSDIYATTADKEFLVNMSGSISHINQVVKQTPTLNMTTIQDLIDQLGGIDDGQNV